MNWNPFKQGTQTAVEVPRKGTMMTAFKDGLTDLLNGLANRRNANARSRITTRRLDDEELREVYKTGLFSKIIRIKTGYALRETIQFDSKEDEKFYNEVLKAHVKAAAKFQLGFGRGIIVIDEPNIDLDQPLSDNFMNKDYNLRVFPGEMISAQTTSRDLRNERYYKPVFYTIRGYQFHWTRVIDFTYWMPVEDDLSEYEYGGLSEAELIYTQLVNDEVVERSSTHIIEKASSFFYKIKGFKQLIQTKQEGTLLRYIGQLEDRRSIYGAGVMDADDDLAVMNQSLTNLKEIDDISLRRLAMVTGIPLPLLVGENVKGLNSAGDTERQTFQDMIGAYQEDFLLEPINLIMKKFGRQPVKFKESQGVTALEQANYEKIVITNAEGLARMGADHNTYLEEKGITKPDDFDSLFARDDDDDNILDDVVETGEHVQPGPTV